VPRFQDAKTGRQCLVPSTADSAQLQALFLVEIVYDDEASTCSSEIPKGSGIGGYSNQKTGST
jgi:hypothetical protein